jgi:hypothetical protein
MYKFLIFSHPYNERNGGTIVLHKLCSIINDLGHECYLYPHQDMAKKDIKKRINELSKSIKYLLLFWKKKYRTNPALNTPVYRGTNNDSWQDWIVVYPEIVEGNPLGARNVVRWLLHQPGFHTGKIEYASNELYYKFNSAINDFSFPGSVTSKNELKIIHYPVEHYNKNELAEKRKGSAYCLRKGIDKPIQHDLSDSILIDGKSNREVAAIFKSVKSFISYDTYTAYSIFAVLCGCDSIVIPDEGVTEEEWYSDPADRYGIAYGFAKLEESRKTAHLVKQHILEEEERSIKNASIFIKEASDYFSRR